MNNKKIEIIKDVNEFLDNVGSDWEGIEALYKEAGLSIDETLGNVTEDIELEKLYIYHEKNKNYFVLEDAPFIYYYIGRASNNEPLIIKEYMKIKGKT